MKELFKQYISHIYMDDDKNYLVFLNKTGQWVYSPEDDCCSTSSFKSIENAENIINEWIIGIEEKPAYGFLIEEHLCERNTVTIYGYTLKTNKGYCDIEFRNESNGYYGGSCEFINDAQLIFPGQDSVTNRELYRQNPLETPWPPKDLLARYNALEAKMPIKLRVIGATEDIVLRALELKD